MKKYNAPKVRESKSGFQLLTTIWLVPLLALIIALWLASQYYAKIGPTIKISFKSNAGLIANQSQIKLRDVTVGMVTQISLAEDGNGVVVKAQMNKEVASYLNHKAKLWIVHPDVGSHGVSGLDTLLSGSYIELHGVKEEYTQKRFIGLENPYIDSEAKGKYYLLSAPASYNVSEGSNVYFRMIKVGRVERVGIAPNGEKVNFTVFVEQKYTPYINNKSQFYAQSTFSVDFSQAKFDMSMASLSQIVHGGISIYTPLQTLHKKNQYKINKGDLFPLYKSLAQMKEKQLMHGDKNQIYKFVFDHTSNKLEIGSPIQFQGFQVGYITDIENHFDKKQHSMKSEIYALVYKSAFQDKHHPEQNSTIEKLVQNGLKAKINQFLPLVGAEYIELVFDKTHRATLQQDNNYTLFPTLAKKSSSSVMDDVKQLLAKLNNLPLESLLRSATKLIDDNNKPVQKVLTDLDKILVENQKPIKKIVKDLDKLIINLKTTVDNVNNLTQGESLQQLPEDMSRTLQEVDETLRQLQYFSQGYSADSTFSAELSATLRELSLAAESIERVSRKLEKKPNSLLLGDD